MVKTRSKEELELMRKSGQITAKALKKVLAAVRVGVTTKELDKIAEEEIARLGGKPAFMSVAGYKWATCITINEQVVHGIPTERVLKNGDLVSIDIGAVFKGWFTDAAWSVAVGEVSKEVKKFLAAGEEALWSGIAQAYEGATVADIGQAIQKKVEGASYSVVKSLVGHGVGRQLHEEPEVPGYSVAGTGLRLQEGMTLAVEVIYTAGEEEVGLEDDGWTISSLDDSLGGLFEMTVIVGKKKGEVITDWKI